MTVSPNPLFKFGSPSYVVKVENIPPNATRKEILRLFTTLIGEVRRCEEYLNGAKKRAFELEFANADCAKKALCMTGYTMDGVPLTVSAAEAAEPSRPTKELKQGDNRRNLYVLGLPFDLTKSEFVEIFSRYGSVSHAVILATVDNASRRRGFVVLNSHREAKLAMDALSRTEIKGHVIDVSWAVVQRSQGFLDGGDRTTMLSQPGTVSTSPDTGFACHTLTPPSPSPEVSGLPTPVESQAPEIAPVPISATTLLVSNLPSVLFARADDLQPLLCPFGDIVNLDIRCHNSDTGNISVLVEYKTAAQAQEARDALHGQCYTNQPVEVEIVQPNMPGPNYWPFCRINAKTGLNPMAAPFSAQWKYCPDELDAMLSQSNTFYSLDDGPVKSDGTQSMGVPTFGVVTNKLASLYDSHPIAHRPHSAPSHPTAFGIDCAPGPRSSTRYLPPFPSTSLRSSFIA